MTLSTVLKTSGIASTAIRIPMPSTGSPIARKSGGSRVASDHTLKPVEGCPGLSLFEQPERSRRDALSAAHAARITARAHGPDMAQNGWIAESVGVPALVMGADRDAFFTRAMIEEAARLHEVVPTFFPEMAHVMMLEPGWRDVAERICAWLDQGTPTARG